MRKTYETEDTIVAQERVLNVVRRAWDCASEKTKEYGEIDYVLTRGDRVCAFVEVKTRTNRHDAYPTYMISGHKFEYGCRWESQFSVPFLIVVEFTDGIYWCRPSGSEFAVRMGGRKDRGDAQDWEVVVHLPMSAWRPLEAERMAA